VQQNRNDLVLDFKTAEPNSPCLHLFPKLVQLLLWLPCMSEMSAEDSLPDVIAATNNQIQGIASATNKYSEIPR